MYTYHFLYVMCFGWKRRRHVAFRRRLLLTLVLLHIVGILFYVVAREAETKRHCG